MKDSSKLFLGALGIIICGFLKGIAPTTLGQPFDVSTFFVFFVIAIIIAILGLVKHAKNK